MLVKDQKSKKGWLPVLYYSVETGFQCAAAIDHSLAFKKKLC